MIKLNDLKFNEGSFKKKKRVSRGNSGKSSGRGDKGQKARSGVSLSNFQGGQTPIERRLPKQISFYTRKGAIGLPIKNIETFFNNGVLKENDKITFDVLRQLGLVKKNIKYKLIGRCSKKIDIEAHAISSKALESISEFKGNMSYIK